MTSEHSVPRARSLERPGGLLRGEEAGAGPTILLLHAGGERRRVWRPVVGVLVEAGFRCVAFDQRGHGDSDGSARALAPFADDVAAMVRAEPSRCVIVGASLGGLAALAALGDPAVRTRVAGLVLVDVVPTVDPDRVRRLLATNPVAQEHSELVDDALAWFPRLQEITAQLDLPVLLVRGASGSSIDDDVRRLLQLAPHVTVTDIPGAGHLVARDQPTALAEAITTAARDRRVEARRARMRSWGVMGGP